MKILSPDTTTYSYDKIRVSEIYAKNILSIT